MGIKCFFLGHRKLKELDRLSDQAILLKCECCLKHFAYNHVERIVLPYDISMQEFYKQFNQIRCRLTDGVADESKCDSQLT
jgi:hypothetical protein